MAFWRRPASALAVLAALSLGGGVADAQASDAFDCKAGIVGSWSGEKQEWCCEKHQVGCSEETEKYDCRAGYYNREFGWAADKKDWCCRNKALGCDSHESSAVLVSDTDGWAIKCSKDCNGENTCAKVCAGEQEQVHRCPAQAECPISTLCPEGTEPTNCRLGEWAAWSPPIGCSGLCQRTRNVTQPNRCGGEPCEGSLRETKECPRPDMCEVKKQDCLLDPWTSWSECGSRVTCQKDRSRAIAQSAMNGGASCDGELTETSACGSDCLVPVDCQMSVYMEWSQCTKKCGGGQQTRLRTIVTRAENGGRPCDGAVQEKRGCGEDPCTAVESANCMLGDWSEWTSCINGQQKMRRRIIVSPAEGAGEACSEPLAETTACKDISEEPVDCQMAEWSGWTLCDKTCDGGQTMRHRKVVIPAKYGGAGCDGPLWETMQCNTHPCSMGVHPCRVSTWSEWSSCSTTCGTGQELRKRAILTQAQMGGVGCDFALSEARGCNEDGNEGNPECPIQDCKWAEWSAWSHCSDSCGGGQRSRSKQIEQGGTMGGKPCEPTDTEETEPCNTEPCHAPHCVDGLWSMWSDWTECTKSCEGGFRFKRRSIVLEGNHCGQPAEGRGTEGTSCNNGIACVQDFDCQYSLWSDWSRCADQCSGTRQRNREIAVPASGRGQRCGSEEEGEGGMLSQIEPCHGLGGAACATKEQADCMFGDWTEWNGCTEDCGGGQQHRARAVLSPSLDLDAESVDSGLFGRRLQTGAYMPQAVVAPVAAPIALPTMPAMPGLAIPPVGTEAEERDCREDYENFEVEWSESKKEWCCKHKNLGCPPNMATGGDAAVSARMCQGPINVTRACNTDSCDLEAVDCAYTDWEMWGACTQCGGQRFRNRDVAQMPTNGGRECDLKNTEETEKCPRTCGPILYYCAWGDWSEWNGECSTTCGTGTEKRRRSMALTDQMPEDPMAIASTQKDCEGELVDLRECEGNPTCSETCVPEDCQLGEWSEWSEPTCEGICKRARTVLTDNNECGKPCEGSLNGTKPCHADCESKDCKLSEWSGWSICASPTDQKYKTRTILQEPAFTGKGCNGHLNVTGSCMIGPEAPLDCVASMWSDWTACSKSCGGGQRMRARSLEQEAKNGGSACHEALQITGACGVELCGDEDDADVVSWDCQWSAWSLWTKCGDDNDQQTYRTRFVMHNAQGHGKSCEGEMKETQGCAEASASNKNCIMSSWTMWSACPVTCDGGQHSRSRSIESHARGGGLQCEGAMLEAKPCGTASCSAQAGDGSTACQVSDWTRWGACSATCGEGYKNRAREIASPAFAGADGCNDVLKEVMACSAGPCEDVVDCKWGAWESWGACVAAVDVCGVGYKRRVRQIETMPSGGGQLCPPLVADQIVPVMNCNGQPQCCINGKYAEWTEWGGCSATCGRGTRKRSRLLAVKETWCGAPAPGSDVDYDGCHMGSCDGDQDCVWSAWSTPTPCSSDCHGSRVKTRNILKNATNAGLGCDGPLEVTERCNPADGQKEPFSCEHLGPSADEQQDCIMGEWSEFTQCSATCESGYQERMRSIKVHPQRGGKQCEPSLREAKSCNAGVQCFEGRVDCAWGDWTKWSECNSFGLKHRSRDVATFPAGGGIMCEGDIRDVAVCGGNSTKKEECGSETYVCQWGQWNEWSGCSTTCGAGGERKRNRKLQVSESTALEALSKAAPAASAVQKKFAISGEELPNLEAQLRNAQAQRMKETIVAFALGSGTFAVLLLALRGARESMRARASTAVVREYDRVPQQAA